MGYVDALCDGKSVGVEIDVECAGCCGSGETYTAKSTTGIVAW